MRFSSDEQRRAVMARVSMRRGSTRSKIQQQKDATARNIGAAIVGGAIAVASKPLVRGTAGFFWHLAKVAAVGKAMQYPARAYTSVMTAHANRTAQKIIRKG